MGDSQNGSEKSSTTSGKARQSDDTIDCVACSISFAKKDAKKHKLWCKMAGGGNGLQSSDNFLSIPEKAMHGFIYDRRLLFSPLIDVESPKELQQLPLSRLRESLIFLHPKSMRNLCLKIGDHVIIRDCLDTGGSDSIPAIAWPLLKTPISYIGVPKTSSINRNVSSQMKTYYSVKKITNLKHASRTTIMVDSDYAKPFHQTDDFKRVCHSYLNGTCLKYPEDTIKIPYYGPQYAVRTISIVDSAFLEQWKAEEEPQYSLEKNFDNLNMDDCRNWTGCALDKNLDQQSGASGVKGEVHENSKGEMNRFDTNSTFSTTTVYGRILRIPLSTSAGERFVLADDSTHLTVEITDTSRALDIT